MPARFGGGGGSGGGGGPTGPVTGLTPLSSLPATTGRATGEIVDVNGVLQELVDAATDGHILHASTAAVSGFYTGVGVGYGSWNDPGVVAEVDWPSSPTALLPRARGLFALSAPVSGVYIRLTRTSNGEVADFALTDRQAARDRLVGTVQLYAYESPVVTGDSFACPAGEGFTVEVFSDGNFSVPLRVHSTARWEELDRAIRGEIQDLEAEVHAPVDTDLTATLPRVDGRSDRAISERSAKAGIDSVARDGAAGWGPAVSYAEAADDAALTAAGAGNWWRFNNRTAVIEPRTAERTGLLAAAGLLVDGVETSAAVTADGSGLAHQHDAGGTSDHDAVSSITMEGGGILRVQTANLASHTDLVAGSIVRFVGVGKVGPPAVALMSTDYYRVVGVDRPNNRFTIYSDTNLGTTSPSAAWSRISAGPAQPSRDLTITGAVPMAAGGMQFWRVELTGTAPQVGDLLSITGITGIDPATVYPVWRRTAGTVDLRIPLTTPPVFALHATRLRAHVGVDLPASGALSLAWADEMVTRRALGNQIQQQIGAVRIPRLLNLWRAAATTAAAGTPSGWGFSDLGAVDPGGTPWFTTPAQVVIPGGQHLIEAVAEVRPQGTAWVVGPWHIYQADQDAEWAPSASGPWHDWPRLATDEFIRHDDPVTGAPGPAIPLYRTQDIRDHWTEIVYVVNYRATNIGPWPILMATSWAIASARELAFEVTIRDSGNNNDTFRSSFLTLPVMAVADNGEAAVQPASERKTFSLVLGKDRNTFGVRDFSLPSYGPSVGHGYYEDLWGIVAKFRRGAADPAGTASIFDLHFMQSRQQFGNFRILAR